MAKLEELRQGGQPDRERTDADEIMMQKLSVLD